MLREEEHQSRMAPLFLIKILTKNPPTYFMQQGKSTKTGFQIGGMLILAILSGCCRQKSQHMPPTHHFHWKHFSVKCLQMKVQQNTWCVFFPNTIDYIWFIFILYFFNQKHFSYTSRNDIFIRSHWRSSEVGVMTWKLPVARESVHGLQESGSEHITLPFAWSHALMTETLHLSQWSVVSLSSLKKGTSLSFTSGK